MVWKSIPNYEGLYEVSDTGLIRSLDRYVYIPSKKINRIYYGKTLKQATDRYGYKEVKLCKNGTEAQMRVHRIVAETFKPNVNGLSDVNHIDGNKANNSIDNLEWVTSSGNRRHAIKNGLWIYSEKNREAFKKARDKSVSVRRKAVECYDLKGNLLNSFESIREAELATGTNNSKITQVCKGKRKTANKMIWKYKEK